MGKNQSILSHAAAVARATLFLTQSAIVGLDLREPLVGDQLHVTANINV
jgi:hypothetical protein